MQLARRSIRVLCGELSKIDCRDVLHPGSHARSARQSHYNHYTWIPFGLKHVRFQSSHESGRRELKVHIPNWSKLSQSTSNKSGAQGLDEGHQGRMFLLKGPQVAFVWISSSHNERIFSNFLGTGWVMKIWPFRFISGSTEQESRLCRSVQLAIETSDF